jgi:predicted acylesterase/phospholipase RssA
MRQLRTRAIVFATKKDHGLVVFDSEGENRDIDAHVAARFSMSIPGFFVPAELAGDKVFDGGLLANFPLEKVNSLVSNSPVVSLYLTPPPSSQRRPWLHRLGPVGPMLEVVNILLSRDESQVVRAAEEETVFIGPIQYGLPTSA